LHFDVHFWLGDSTSQDEAGTAAYKTVELDDALHGAPIQHREVQGYESALFLSYFKNPIQIMEGGVGSGFHQVKPEDYKPRLLQIKGKKKVRVTEVPLARSSLNSGDIFILDLGTQLFTFVGHEAGVSEKSRGMQVAESIESSRNGKAHNTTIEEGDADDKFWGPLGGKGPIESAAEGGSDLEAPHGDRRISRITENDGHLTITEVATGADVKRSLLNTQDSFIVDSGEEIFVWVGKGSSAKEQKHALDFATNYLEHHNLPAWEPIARVAEGMESQSFKRAFAV